MVKAADFLVKEPSCHVQLIVDLVLGYAHIEVNRIGDAKYPVHTAVDFQPKRRDFGGAHPGVDRARRLVVATAELIGHPLGLGPGFEEDLGPHRRHGVEDGLELGQLRGIPRELEQRHDAVCVALYAKRHLIIIYHILWVARCVCDRVEVLVEVADCKCL